MATSDLENESAPEDDEVHLRKQKNMVEKLQEEFSQYPQVFLPFWNK